MKQLFPCAGTSARGFLFDAHRWVMRTSRLGAGVNQSKQWIGWANGTPIQRKFHPRPISISGVGFRLLAIEARQWLFSSSDGKAVGSASVFPIPTLRSLTKRWSDQTLAPPINRL